MWDHLPLSAISSYKLYHFFRRPEKNSASNFYFHSKLSLQERKKKSEIENDEKNDDRFKKYYDERLVVTF